MIKLKFFANFRELLGESELQLSMDIKQLSVGKLREHLKQRGPAWAEVMSHPKLLVAVNQNQCDDQQIITTGDEVAFYPPVSGG